MHLWVLIVGFLAAAIFYSFGLSGGFVFDDYPQIVINDNLRSVSTWVDVSRVIVSGNAGPGGRPLPLLTFAAQIAWTGLDPYYFKLLNIVVHLINGLLLYGFLSFLLTAWHRQRADVLVKQDVRVVAALVTVWWLLSPLGLTSVLYVVQRMNSMSAMFCLAGLYGYVYFRDRGLAQPRWNLAAIAWLLSFAALSFYSKETGLLIFCYVWLIEFFLFSKTEKLPHAWRVFFRFVRISPLIAIGFGVLAFPVWQNMLNYTGRSFTLLERVLTQSRVLFFHLGQILFPHAASFSLYHDDFSISRAFFDPPSTALTIVGHLVSLLLVFVLRKRFPIFCFGITWFYIGHLLESTIFPLEMVFEHRNYLPMVGPVLAIFSLLFNCTSKFNNRNLLVVGLVSWISFSGLVMAVRADAWGDPLYPIHEAERKPQSARANYDAGIALLNAVSDDQAWNTELFKRGELYFDRSIANEPEGVAALVGLIELSIRVGKAPDKTIFLEMERRLSEGIPHANLMFSLLSLHQILSKDSPYFTDVEAERLYRALLTNPMLGGIVKSHCMAAYGLLKGKQGKIIEGLEFLKNAVDETPHINEFRVLYIAALIDQKMFVDARIQLDNLRSRDRYGVFEQEIHSLAEQLPHS